jgi:histidinol phosphatase-like PHP family hydrolase
MKIIVAHGETVVEPVVPGTNHAALEADIDILAHPGMISDKDVLLAKKNGIFLEITSRSGHRETNSHVAARALALGARLILNTDGHRPEDIISPEELRSVGSACGISEQQLDSLYHTVEAFLRERGCL